MNEIVAAAGIMTGVAGFFGVVLAVANRYLKVWEDPRIDQTEEMLPGSNCGACGEPGCRAFAEALVRGEGAPGQCSVSSPEAVAGIALYLGVDAGFQEKRVARLHCAGGLAEVRTLAEYRGFPSCRGAHVVNGGGRACPWGCLGLGDCEDACTFHAIRMTDNLLPLVDPDLCTACGDCVDVCPLDLFTIEPLSTRAIVQCSSLLAGDEAREVCRVACDACGRCAADAPSGAVEMKNNLPVVQDPARAPEACTFRCPSGAIQWVDGPQLTRRERALRHG